MKPNLKEHSQKKMWIKTKMKIKMRIHVRKILQANNR